jgi:uroporphyrinogen decarboxylase
MNSRDRVIASLEHKEPDRLPFDLGATPMTGIHIQAYQKLRSYLNLPDESVKIEDTIQQLASVSEDVHQILQTDVHSVLPHGSDLYQMVVRDEGDYTAYNDEMGVGWRKPKVGGFYYDMAGHPFEKAQTIEDMVNHTWPDPIEKSRFIGVREKAQAVRDEGKAVVLGGLCAGVSEMHSWMRGYINYFSDFLLNPEIAEYIMDTVVEMKMRYWERMLAEVGDLADVVVEADDLAGQDRMLISPSAYRKYIKPRHTKLFSFIKSKAPVKIFFHSCGAVRPVIGDLIESGVDILNPVQKSAANMNLVELKRDFGKDVVFWGGGVDTQRIFGSGTPQEVEDDVKRSMDALAPGGGFIFATVHNTQANVPPENIMAMWNTLHAYGIYK